MLLFGLDEKRSLLRMSYFEHYFQLDNLLSSWFLQNYYRNYSGYYRSYLGPTFYHYQLQHWQHIICNDVFIKWFLGIIGVYRICQKYELWGSFSKSKFKFCFLKQMFPKTLIYNLY